MIEPLNLQLWLVNIFAGSPLIFITIAIIAIAGLAAYFRMGNYAFLIFFSLFAIMINVAGFATWLTGLVMIPLGIIVFSIWSKIWNR